ncbi:MAG: sulfatase-like hydrolase/transferase, partial [Aquihabitans sp.]
LFALSGFAIAQPLLDVFGKAPDRFVFRGATSRDIWAFALLAIFAVPVVLWLVELGVQAVDGRARRGIHLGFIGLLVAAFATQALRPLVSGPVLIAIALTVGVLVAALYVRSQGVQLWLSVCAAAPPVFAALFLLASPTSQLLAETNTLGVVPESSRAPVVMIVFDELPLASLIDADGTIDAELFPNFAALADDSHWFRNTTTVSNFTWNALPAIVTGMLPKDGESPLADSHPKNIFTLLGGSMDLKVTESISRLCPVSLCALDSRDRGGLSALVNDARHVMRYRLAPNPPPEDPVAGNVEDEAAKEPEKLSAEERKVDGRSQQFLDGLDDGSDTLHFLHVLLPHVPFRYLPDGFQYEGPSPDLARDSDNWLDQPALLDLGRHRHLLQLGYADEVLGQTMQAMKDNGFYDDAVLTVVADHGVSFLPGEEIRALDNSRTDISDEVKSDIMWVPFFVKEPGQTEGTVSDADVRTIDVLPTIADVLNLTLSWETDGQSALGPERTGEIKGFHRSDKAGDQFLAGPLEQLDADRGYEIVLDHAVDRFLPAIGDPLRWWKTEPDADLVGRPLDEIIGTGTALTRTASSLAASSKADDVDLSSGFVPSLVLASTPHLQAGDEAVVSVNGTVWAGTKAYDLGDGPSVAAIVPREAFADGANEVEIYAVN